MYIHKLYNKKIIKILLIFTTKLQYKYTNNFTTKLLINKIFLKQKTNKTKYVHNAHIT